ncbi:bifunctional glutamate N-acetyltransferase/amino-acid acetyltransferase ArgJ [Thermodesulfobacterium hydrogeniphilum]|uniref:bifunctional glutamate N-acetyltransferase/amino-acid acetyltransferase ArgJ n=1 Tax=Thermodesulfobacterium hydrogeniphilum TaxID=161156 RepID=UPI00056E065B|nr:bifunctional glutamate N-acetyltransferase/amino-acid acetyltransferase ArgJ [Thermodesulfobacterium hydrogeniphilum]
MFVPEGFLFSAVSCGIKKEDKLDLGLIYSSEKLTAWGVFTKNIVKAAPVILGKKLIKGKEIFGIVANSGVANACTGDEGLVKAQNLLEEIAKRFKLSYKNFLPASTGVIGEQLPLNKILPKIEKLISGLTPDNYISFAKAIMTTDTFPKIVSKKTIDDIVVMGIAKGAGMIAPNMATMLGFILTDAIVSKETLKKLLPKMVDQSFNRITVDSDTSTNDTVYMLCSNRKEIKDWDSFENTCKKVAKELAYLIIKDGEGASKVIKITIKGAKTKEEAKNLAFAIANSPLVKTAFYGGDPNWGRIFAALGKTGIYFHLDKIEIYLNNHLWIKDLKVATNEDILKDEIQKEEIELLIKLKDGKQSYEVLTTDLTEEYVKINAHYRT